MKCVLITGATGAVGSALAPLFLREPGTQVRLLLRARSGAHLRQRLDELVAYWKDDPAGAPPLDRVVPLAGDVGQPRLGLSPEDYDRLGAEVTHVVHSAGNVKLNQPIEEARRSAVEPAAHVVALARECQRNGQFRKLEFVSTVGVAGRTPGLIREEPMTHPRGFHNTYEQAKAEAEVFLLKEMRDGLPATIHRPSMVVGDSRTGAIIHFQVFYYLAEFFSGLNTWGVVPATGRVRLDIIPCDYVARITHLSSRRPEAAGRVFHLCSGPDHSRRISELTTELRRLFREQGAVLRPLVRVLPGWLRCGLPLVRHLVRPKTRRLLQTLPYFLDYLAEEQVFDNTRTRAFFSPEGPPVPRVEDYLPQLMRYYWTHKYVPEAVRPAG